MTKHEDTPLELATARSDDTGLIASLLDDYLRELSAYRDQPAGPTDSSGYRHLDAYWSEAGRHAFLIRREGRVAGFAFIRDPASTGSAAHEFTEFYIEPASRRLGIGRRGVYAIWKRFPGNWQFQVHARNSGGVRFWSSCVEGGPSKDIQVRGVQDRDGQRLQFDFRVGDRAPCSHHEAGKPLGRCRGFNMVTRVRG